MTRKTLIVSDIHLGNGGAYDIYAGGDALGALLDSEAGPGLLVIFNGDAVDFLLNDEALTLELDRALAIARSTVAHPDTAGVMAAIGRVLAAGGEVRIRLGNHDVELAIPEVQALFREATGQPAPIAARLVFETGQQPGVLEIGGARVLYCHGEHNDSWNQVDYDELMDREAWGRFAYPPGSRLVKRILNPLKRDFGMRFADLLKPDFNGAVMAGLAVDPSAVRAAAPRDVAALTARVLRRSFQMPSFDVEELDEFDAMGDVVADAELSDEEREAIAGLLEDRPQSFGVGDRLADALQKLGRRALGAYAKAHRVVGAKAGQAYFSLEPSEAEWKEAQRLAKDFGADAVIIGHTHAARWRESDGVVYANTGTWIGLMQLPGAEDADADWEAFLDLLRENPGLDPKRGPSVPVLTRFTGVEITPAPAGGAVMALVEWRGEERIVLGETRIAAG